MQWELVSTAHIIAYGETQKVYTNGTPPEIGFLGYKNGHTIPQNTIAGSACSYYGMKLPIAVKITITYHPNVGSYGIEYSQNGCLG